MKLVAALFTVSLLSLLGGCSTMLSAEPVTARVVDASTGKPLAGVAVVAYWELHNGSFTGHSFGCGAIDIEGAVTDADGQFHIPGWGPINSSCDMWGFNPILMLFKPSYVTASKGNNPLNSLAMVSVSSSIWDGKTIEMRVADTDLERVDAQSYAFDFESFNNNLARFVLAGCNWKKIPDMLRAIAIQERKFRAAGQVFPTVNSRLIRLDAEIQKAEPRCGSPKAFIEGLVK